MIKKFGSETQVGKMAIEVRLKILESIVMPSILYGTEVFINLTKKDNEDLEKLQKQLLVGLFEVEESTPYLGLILESGILPMKNQIDYKKLMLYHWLLTSDDERMAKKVLLDQEDCGISNCWYSELEEIAEAYKIDISIGSINKKTKSTWKRK